ncbi:MAG: RNA methyltransferase [Ignavibacteria bacterium]|nr:RNA methyltransferase [Ignavibacteria bacterium]
MTKNELKLLEKLKQKKFRDEEGKFLIEGVHLIEECLNSERYMKNLERVFIRDDFENDDLIEKFRNSDHFAEIEYLPESIFKKLSETVTSQGIIGVVKKAEDYEVKDTQKTERLVIIAAENINDPGNLGTIIRTCHWFGADKLIISKNSADIYNSKVIRASQGSLFYVNVQNEADLKHELQEYHSLKYKIIVTDLIKGKDLSEIEFSGSGNYVVVLGNEAEGVSREISENENYEKIKVKGFSECESLNVSVTAGIILYEITK